MTRLAAPCRGQCARHVAVLRSMGARAHSKRPARARGQPERHQLRAEDEAGVLRASGVRGALERADVGLVAAVAMYQTKNSEMSSPSEPKPGW